MKLRTGISGLGFSTPNLNTKLELMSGVDSAIVVERSVSLFNCSVRMRPRGRGWNGFVGRETQVVMLNALRWTALAKS